MVNYYLFNAILFVLFILFEGIKPYFMKKSQNLATKQDIGKITKELEIVKNEVSAHKQRETDFIYKRTECLISYLNLLDELDLFRMRINPLFDTIDRLSFSDEYLVKLEHYIIRLSMKYRRVILYNPYRQANKAITDDYNCVNEYYNFLYSIAYKFHAYSQAYTHSKANNNDKEAEKIIESTKELHKKFEDSNMALYDEYRKTVDSYNIFLESYFKENLNIEL